MREYTAKEAADFQDLTTSFFLFKEKKTQRTFENVRQMGVVFIQTSPFFLLLRNMTYYRFPDQIASFTLAWNWPIRIFFFFSFLERKRGIVK